MYFEIKASSYLRVGIKELWDYRELFYYFTLREIQVKYKQTILGVIWAVLQPLLMMMIFTLFFNRLFNTSDEGIPYPVYVLSGLILWGLFSSGIMNSSNAMVSNANIIKKIYFPRMIIPLSSILASLFDFLMALLLFILIMIWYSPACNMQLMLLCLPLSVLLSITAAIGPGLLLCALNVKYRDFRYIVPFLIQLLLFLTPVFYPASVLKFDVAKYLLALNPMSAAISLFRLPFAIQPLDLWLFGLSIASNIILLFIGLIYFRKTENYFADIV